MILIRLARRNFTFFTY